MPQLFVSNSLHKKVTWKDWVMSHGRWDRNSIKFLFELKDFSFHEIYDLLYGNTKIFYPKFYIKRSWHKSISIYKLYVEVRFDFKDIYLFYFNQSLIQNKIQYHS